MRSIFCTTLGAAFALLPVIAHAGQYSNPTGGGSSVAGGACPTGQAANGVAANTGAPTGCFIQGAGGLFSTLAYQTGKHYLPFGYGVSATAGIVATANRLSCSFVFWWSTGMPATLDVVVSTADAAATPSATVGAWIALYANAVASGLNRPTGTPLVYANEDILATGTKTPAVTAGSGVTSIAPQWLWACAATSSAAARIQGSAYPFPYAAMASGFNSAGGITSWHGIVASSYTYAATPPDLTSITWTDNTNSNGSPLIGMGF